MTPRSALLMAVASAWLGCTGEPMHAQTDAGATAPTISATTPGTGPEAAGDAGVAHDAGHAEGDAGVPPPPRVRLLEVPEESRSPLPKTGEWNDIVRRNLYARPEYECTIQRVREWHRITCNCSNPTAQLVAGERDGVLVWAGEDRAQIIFPVRRGDRRVLEIHPHSKQVFVGGYQGFSEQAGGPSLVISETWLEGDDAPALVLQ